MPLIDLVRWVRQRPWLAVALALAVFAIAFGARIVLSPVLEGLPFITLYPAIVIAGLLGGPRLGLLVAVLSAVFAWFWLLPPADSFGLWSRVITLGLFGLSSSVLLYIFHALDRAVEASARERDHAAILLQELQHRTANNMAFLSSLVRLQRKAGSENPEAVRAFNSISQRIETINQIQRSLYGPTGTERSLREHLDDLCRNVLQATDAANITCVVAAIPTILDVNRLVLLSRLVAELVTNSAKHAFANKPSGKITVRLAEEQNRLVLTVSDDGRGLPDSFSLASNQGLGLRIVESLAKQLGGEIKWTNSGGAVACLSFPAQADRIAIHQPVHSSGFLFSARKAFGEGVPKADIIMRRRTPAAQRLGGLKQSAAGQYPPADDASSADDIRPSMQ